MLSQSRHWSFYKLWILHSELGHASVLHKAWTNIVFRPLLELYIEPCILNHTKYRTCKLAPTWYSFHPFNTHHRLPRNFFPIHTIYTRNTNIPCVLDINKTALANLGHRHDSSSRNTSVKSVWACTRGKRCNRLIETVVRSFLCNQAKLPTAIPLTHNQCCYTNHF
jgi:hypothetical protein